MDKIVNQGIDICIEEFKKQDNKKTIEDNILDPIIKYIGERLWPYILYSVIFMCSLIILLFYTIYIINKKI